MKSKTVLFTLVIGTVLWGLPAPVTAASSTPSAVSIHGVLTTPSGAPVGGTTVQLDVWPTNAVLAALHPGDTVPTLSLSSATSAADGSYQVSIPSGTDLSSFVNADGAINAHIDAVGSPATGTSGVIIHPAVVAAAGLAPHASGAAHLALARMSSHAGDLEITANMHVFTHPGSRIAQSRPMRGGMLCYWRDIYDEGSQQTIIGVTYSQLAGGVNANVTYTNGASSSLGIGVSLTGDYGTFSASGTSDVSATGTQKYATQKDIHGTYYDTFFTYHLYGWDCPGYAAPLSYEVQPVAWDGGGVQETNRSIPTYIHCRPEGRGESFSAVSTTADTYTVGISSSIGINLDATTGYSTSAAVNYDFWNTAGQLCGRWANPGTGTFGRLEALP